MAKQAQDTSEKQGTETQATNEILVNSANLFHYIELLNPEVASWSQFGYALYMGPGIIDAIEKKPIKLEPKDKMIKVLKLLQKKGPLDWTKVVKAVKAMKFYGLAEELPQTGEEDFSSETIWEELLKQLKDIIPQWRRFGMFMGIPPVELEGIDVDVLTSNDCFEELMIEWIKQKGKKATVSELERACRSIGNNALADKIKNDTEDTDNVDIN